MFEDVSPLDHCAVLEACRNVFGEQGRRQGNDYGFSLFTPLRVKDLVQQSVGKSFAPAGRLFKEWVLVEAYDEARWLQLMEEAKAFVVDPK